MNSVCVCGAGTMGSGIAQVCASAGLKTILYDLDPSRVRQASEKLNSDLSQLVAKGKITEENKGRTLSLLQFTSELQHCIADLIIEAVVERPEVKVDLFNKLSSFNSNHTIYASNTSSLSITNIASHTADASRVAGLHFFNPAPLMKLVEVVKGKETSVEVIQQLLSFTRTINKLAVVCTDSPGFIVNRVARPYYIESLRIAEEGRVTMESIDRILEARGFRMGPFRLMDLIGNDVNYAVSCSVYDQLGSPERLRPSDIQKEKVEKGELGKKTGKGYYSY